MLKNLVALEVMKGERLVRLEVSDQMLLGELYDALCQMQSFIIKKIVDSQGKEKKDEPEVITPEVIV